MRIKKYEVKNMQEALKVVRDDLGDNAVILRTRKIMKNTGLGGIFSRPVIEVTAGVDEKFSGEQAKSKLSAGSQNYTQNTQKKQEMYNYYKDQEVTYEPSAKGNGAKAGAKKGAAKQSASSSMNNGEYSAESALSSLAERLAAKTNAGAAAASVDKDLEEFLSMQGINSKDIVAQPNSSQSPVQQVGGAEENIAELINSLGLNKFEKLLTDIVDIKKDLQELKSSSPSGSLTVDLGTHFREYYAFMTKNGVDEVIAYQFLRKLEKSGSHEKLTKNQLRSLIIETLDDFIPIEHDYFATLSNKVIALVGPTGVGKTTTTAKIAATLALKMNKTVSLITIDNFRIGAVEQLKTYAEIVNIPLYVASTPSELADVLVKAKQSEYVLLDSMGRSQFDDKEIANIKEFMNVDDDIKIALVLSLASNHIELNEVFDRYSSLYPEYLLFTKLDETRYFGPLINLPIKKKVPLLLLSTGQNVPDDIESPNGKKIARKVLNEVPMLWADK